jgi:PadR family transcriptional regulator, regulatory protein AphA
VSARADKTDAAAHARMRPAKASLEHALLGLIAEVPGISGYDILKVFRFSMVHYWHAQQGQIYPTLERMECQGLVRSRAVAQRGRPNKRLYTITPDGQHVLVEWLRSPFEGFKLKHPPLLRCRFLGHLGAAGALEKLAEERTAWERQLALFRGIERSHFSGARRYTNVNAMFSYFTLRRGIDWMQENIRWCDWAAAEIARNRHLFGAVPVAMPKRRATSRRAERRASAAVS